MTIEEIRELIQVVHETGIAELEVARGDNRVRIRRSTGAAMPQEIILPAASMTMTPSQIASPASPPPGLGASRSLAPAAPVPGDTSIYVKSPIVGTFYESPSPGSAAFVKVGDAVTPGQVLCIIESMKLMNEIESEVSGIILRRLVDTGKPVEYGESLFAIQPA